MKRILIATAAMLCAASYSFGQGETIFTIGGTAGTRVWTNTVVGGQTPDLSGTNLPGAGLVGGGAGQYMFALFTAPNALDSSVGNKPWLDPAWAFSQNYATNIATAGRAVGNYNANGSITVPGYAAGATAALQVVGWNTAVGGTSLASFQAAFAQGSAGLVFGYSDVAHILLGDGALILNSSIFGAQPNQAVGFFLAPIPEPTTFALAGLGAAAMLIFRRRR